MKFNIKTKLSISFGLVLLLFLSVIAMDLNVRSESNKHLMHIMNVTSKQVEYSIAVKTSVIEVQQFLTDASLTRSGDSLKEAEKYKAVFEENIKNLKNQSTDFSDEIIKIEKDFNDFYNTGTQMANTYMNEGTDKGNGLMAEFDSFAVLINDETAVLLEKSNDLLKDDLMTTDEYVMMNQQLSIAFGIFALILTIIIVILLGKQITIPISKLLTILKDIEAGEGDLTKRINIRSGDEIGKTAQSFNRFMDSLENIVANIKKETQVVSDGSEKLNTGGLATREGINAINSVMMHVTEDTQKIAGSINGITAGISEIAQSSQSTAADAREICNTAENIYEIAQESGKLALDAKVKMENIEGISADTVSITELLGSQAGEIGKIIDAIKAITEQTNLLALNAAIEAARAGEHGKGFGVVADEIRKLAESNNQSAKMIENLVKNIQELIGKTVNAAVSTGQNIKQGGKIVENVYAQLNHIIDGIGGINERIQSIAAATEEQSASTEELSATMEAINGSNNKITAAVQEVAASIDSQTETVNNLSSIASDLSNSSESLNGLVNKFKL